MKIAEIFYSIQGEGKLAGVPSVFVRASGCNLRCVWCDTPYASWEPQGDQLAVGEIVRQVKRHDASHLVLTGGEPMIMPDIVELCTALKAEQMHITMETAATVFRPVEIDLASLSPKLANSTPHDRDGGKHVEMHEKQRLNFDVMQEFIDASPQFQLKFVVSHEGDLDEIHEILGKLKGWRPEDVLLMPEGIDAGTLHTARAGLRKSASARAFAIVPVCTWSFMATVGEPDAPFPRHPGVLKSACDESEADQDLRL